MVRRSPSVPIVGFHTMPPSGCVVCADSKRYTAPQCWPPTPSLMVGMELPNSRNCPWIGPAHFLQHRRLQQRNIHTGRRSEAGTTRCFIQPKLMRHL
jgi:hypothetical protein